VGLEAGAYHIVIEGFRPVKEKHEQLFLLWAEIGDTP
jgi:hypothetical protein